MFERFTPDAHRLSQWRSFLRQLGYDLLALLWPSVCIVCGAADRDLCDPCRAELRKRAEVFPIGAVAFGDGAATLSDGAAASGDEAGSVFVAGPYEGALKALLIALKHGGRIGFARVLGEQLAGPLEAAQMVALADAPATNRSSPVIVTVASRPSRVRERGYRHVDVIVRQALRAMRLRQRQMGHLASGEPLLVHGQDTRSREPPHEAATFVPGALRATRGRTGQVGLSVAQRERNAARIEVPAHKWVRIHGRNVILVDDIITTGATMRGATAALEAAGARVLAVVALCETKRRHSA